MEPATKLAVTRAMLLEMRDALPEYARTRGLQPTLASAVWAATVVAFFGMFRKDNVTVQRQAAFNAKDSLCRADFL